MKWSESDVLHCHEDPLHEWSFDVWILIDDDITWFSPKVNGYDM